MLTDEQIKEIAKKWAFKYTHCSAPMEPVFSFMDRSLVDFGKAVEAEALKEQSAKLAELERQLAEVQAELADARKDAERFRFDGEKQCRMPSMSLRDYFAAKAMQSYLLDKDRDSFTFEQWANAAYEMADAMIKARKQGENHDHT